MKLSLKTFLLFGCLSVLSMPAWAIKGVYSLKHDELVQKGIGFLIDEEVLPEKEAKCLVTSLNKAMAESTFDVMFRVALNEEDPSSILNAPKSDSRLPTAKKKRIYQESYDSCMKGEENKSDKNSSESTEKTRTLSAENYMTYTPDFKFDNDIPFGKGFSCKEESIYCISEEYSQIGGRQKAKEKYSGKVVLTQLTAWAYSNGAGDDVYIDNSKSISEDAPMSMAIVCHLNDPQNIQKYANDSKGNKATINVIGVVSEISSYDAKVMLDPCFFVSVDTIVGEKKGS